MNIFLIILSIICAVTAIAFTIRPYITAPIPAYISLWLLKFSDTVYISNSILIGWGLVTAVTVLIDIMQPQQISKATNGTIYISIGAMAGMIVGLSTLSVDSCMWAVTGAIAGAIFGTIIYGRSASAAPLQFPSARFRRYALAKIFPVAVTWSLLAILIFSWLVRYYSHIFLF